MSTLSCAPAAVNGWSLGHASGPQRRPFVWTTGSALGNVPSPVVKSTTSPPRRRCRNRHDIHAGTASARPKELTSDRPASRSLVIVGIRWRVGELLDRTGVVRLGARAPLPFLRILGYHRLGDPKVVARETDEGVVDATADEFARQMEFVARRFDVIGLDALRRHFTAGAPLPKRPALVTFDDGYRECFDVAFPILRRLEIPAVFFVSTDHVTERRAFWWDRIAHLVKKSEKTRATIEFPSILSLDLANDRAGALDAALAVVKRTPGLDLERYLDALARALGVPWTSDDEARMADATIMTWDQGREMLRAGMAIESHSASHRVLQILSDAELERELTHSKRTLERELDAPITAIAYPNGGSLGSHTRIGRAVRAAGYDLGFSGNGICRIGRADPLDLQRISFEVGVPDAYYRACVVFPPVGFG